MYTAEKTDYGVRFTFGGLLSAEECRNWLKETIQLLDNSVGDLCVFVDMRTLAPLDPEGQEVMQEGQRLCRQRGMKRSVVILSSPVIRMQFQHIAHDTGIYKWERYIDASQTPGWEQVGLDWLLNGIDPDLQPVAKSVTSTER